MDKNRPTGRKKRVTSGGTGAYRRGSGDHSGPVGTGHSPGLGGSGGSGSGGNRAGGGISLPMIIGLIIVLLGGGGGIGSALLGGGGGSGSGSGGQSFYQMATGGSGSSSTSGWADGKSNTGTLNTSVSDQARKRYTTIKGDGSDIVTFMVYMCGADLESRSGMATNDLMEMANAASSKNINLIVYTGGAKNWRNNIVSSKVNQIYQVSGGGLKCLEKNAGSGAMTDPATLTQFIKYCSKNFPANRNELIFWDHGGGSVSGYGYDEKNAGRGSMSLAGINTALKNAGMKFDFIGFDTCLMATIENAQMLAKYADYLVASEETEPGVGWYYTDWLTKLSKDPGMPTIEIGKNIIDDFVKVCNQKCPGQQTTLSLIDLAELEMTVPDDFTAFAKDTRNKISKKDYQTVSTARSNAREFARSSAIDQIDLVHFAKNMGTKEGKQLAATLLEAIKYNKTSSNMTNAFGLSAYFPYKKTRNVDKAVQTYEAIGVDDEYSQCIREFASMEVGGQIASGGTGSPLSSLFGNLETGSSSQSAGDITQLLNAFLNSQSGITGLTSGNSNFFTDKSLKMEDMAEYISDHQFDTSNLFWQTNDQGQQVLSMDEDQWNLITDLGYAMYLDDGSGYIDLGVDNLMEFDDDGNLIGEVDGTWISINNHPVYYEHLDSVKDGDNYMYSGKVPAKLNGEKVNIILVFDQDHEYGYVAGARPVYDEKVSETESKGLIELKKGDKIDFLCDYYGYDGQFKANYKLGKQLVVPGTMEELTISNTKVGDAKEVIAMYRLTDIYQQQYWTERIPH